MQAQQEEEEEVVYFARVLLVQSVILSPLSPRWYTSVFCTMPCNAVMLYCVWLSGSVPYGALRGVNQVKSDVGR